MQIYNLEVRLLKEIEAIRNWIGNNPNFEIADISEIESTAPD